MMLAPGTTPDTSRRRGLAWPAVIALIGFSILIGLGLWQLERKTWKEGLIAALAERVAAEPIDLPPPAQWSALASSSDEFRRVRMRVTFSADSRPAWLYTGASALRDDVKSAGYFVFAPARLAGGQQIVVNRGFAPDRTAPPAEGSFEITGYLRWAEKPGWLVSPHDSSGETWLIRDPAGMAAARGWGSVATFYVDMETSVPMVVPPRPGPLKVTLKNDHLNYALTWFSLAAVLACIFGLWLWRQLRERRRTSA